MPPVKKPSPPPRPCPRPKTCRRTSRQGNRPRPRPGISRAARARSTRPAPSPSSDHVKSEVVGREREVREIFAGMLSRKHILLEGPPGTSKSTIVRAIARSMHVPFYFIEGEHRISPVETPGLLQPGQSAEGQLPARVFRDGSSHPGDGRRGCALPRGVQSLGVRVGEPSDHAHGRGGHQHPPLRPGDGQRRLHHHLQSGTPTTTSAPSR